MRRIGGGRQSGREGRARKFQSVEDPIVSRNCSRVLPFSPDAPPLLISQIRPNYPVKLYISGWVKVALPRPESTSHTYSNRVGRCSNLKFVRITCDVMEARGGDFRVICSDRLIASLSISVVVFSIISAFPILPHPCSVGDGGGRRGRKLLDQKHM